MKIVFQQQYNNFNITIRYPKKGDAEQLRDFINTISKEKTYISKQGEIVGLEDEKKYVNDLLIKISKNKVVQLLIFNDDKLIGNAGIELGELTQKHIGAFGISLKKEYRGKGIGSLLMKTILEESQKKLKNLEIFQLTVQAPNKIAKTMYEKFGFKEYGRLPNGVKLENGYRDHVFMYKTLS